LVKGADVKAKINNGLTALGAAKRNGHTDIVQLLEKAGANE
jgi:ankyrin repeat protein